MIQNEWRDQETEGLAASRQGWTERMGKNNCGGVGKDGGKNENEKRQWRLKDDPPPLSWQCVCWHSTWRSSFPPKSN